MSKSEWSPEQMAFRCWIIHATVCRICRIDESRCVRAKRMQAAWKTIFRSTSTLGTRVSP